MATAKRKQGENQKTVPNQGQKPATVSTHTKLSCDVYARLKSFKERNGIFADAEVVRLAVAYFLDKNGY